MRGSLFKQTGLLPCLLDLWHSGIACSCASKMWFLKTDQHLWTPKASKADFQGTLLNSPLYSLKFALLKFRVATLLSFFLIALKIFNSTISWSLWQIQTPTITSTTSPSLFTNSKSRRASYLVGSLSTCDKELSSPTNFKNFQDLLITGVWYSSLMSGKLKSPRRTRATDPDISPNCP